MTNIVIDVVTLVFSAIGIAMSYSCFRYYFVGYKCLKTFDIEGKDLSNYTSGMLLGIVALAFQIILSVTIISFDIFVPVYFSLYITAIYAIKVSIYSHETLTNRTMNLSRLTKPTDCSQVIFEYVYFIFLFTISISAIEF
jgi:hypothetical protein